MAEEYLSQDSPHNSGMSISVNY